MIVRITPNLMVPDVNRTVEYYRDVLGFAYVIGVPQGSQEVLMQFDRTQSLAFAIMQQDGVQMMFQSQQSMVEDIPGMDGKPLGATATFYIELDDVGKLYQQLQGLVDFLSPLKRMFYGKDEFCIRDCNGYALCFAGDPGEKSP